jgi:hypothetical protein
MCICLDTRYLQIAPCFVIGYTLKILQELDARDARYARLVNSRAQSSPSHQLSASGLLLVALFIVCWNLLDGCISLSGSVLFYVEITLSDWLYALGAQRNDM